MNPKSNTTGAFGPRPGPRGKFSVHGIGEHNSVGQTRTSSSPASNSSSALLMGATRASSTKPEMNNNHHNTSNCFAETKWIHSQLTLGDQVSYERMQLTYPIRFYCRDTSPKNNSSNKNLDCKTSTTISSSSSSSSTSSSLSSLFTPPPAKIICVKNLELEARNTPLEWRGDLLAAKLQFCHPNIVAYHGCEPTSQKDSGSRSHAFSSLSSRKVTLQMDCADRLCFHNFTEDIVVFMSKRREKFDDDRSNNPSQMDQLEHAMIDSCLKSVARQSLLGLFNLYKVHGILHRDVKPGNLLVFENGAIRLTDFETAVPDPGQHASQTKTGTTIFQAPELRGPFSSTKNTDKSKPDVWSLGMTLLFSKVRLMFGLDPAKRLKSSNSTVRKFEKLVNGNWRQYLSQDDDDDDEVAPTAGELKFVVLEMADIAFSSDFGLKQLVREMLSVDPEQRCSVTQALAMTFVLTPKICLALQKSSNKNGSENFCRQHQQGWSAMKQLHRDVEAEKILSEEFKIKTCDDALIGVETEFNNNNNSAFTWKDFDVKVNQVHAALKDEAEQFALHAKPIQNNNNNNSEISSTAVEQWAKIRYLMNQRVVYRRQFEQVEILREIIALIPMATKKEVQTLYAEEK